jgi:hypothetical protein
MKLRYFGPYVNADVNRLPGVRVCHWQTRLKAFSTGTLLSGRPIILTGPVWSVAL